MIAPYYRSEDGSITVYHRRWEDIVAAGLVPLRDVALVHDDPSYGVGEQTDRATRGRGKVRGRPRHVVINGRVRGIPKSNDFPPLVGDDEPHDPLAVLSLERPTVLWGANHYASRIPIDSPSWILWDKREGTTSDDNADGELAWTNLGGPLRIFRHLWRGTCRASETGVPHLHPTQKPVALCVWIYQRAKLKPGDLVFVPHMGSGPDLAACRAMGLRCIACDCAEWCCRTAVGARLGAAPKPEPAHALGPLFALSSAREPSP